MKKIAIVLISIFLLVSCQKQEEVEKVKQVNYFEFNYGSELEGYYEYILKEDQYPRLIIKSSGEAPIKYDIDRYVKTKDMKDLSNLVYELDLASWNNFHERGGNETTGKSFNLRIAFKDNSYIGASGFMKFPSGFEEKSEKIKEFLDKLSKKL